MTYFTERRGNLGGRGPQRIMAQLENGFPREYGLKLALVRLLRMQWGLRREKELPKMLQWLTDICNYI